jgi:UDP-N-acetylmuramyl pentapeptide phosphotransferase/UDP-N-acetylglucosamine-1-phosphate transferase
MRCGRQAAGLTHATMSNTVFPDIVLVLAGAVAAMLSAALIVVLMPLLRKYALARPNARSSHTIPTPQGGGGAVVIATLAVALAVSIFFPSLNASLQGHHWILFAAVVVIATIGGIDDIRPIEVLPRLSLQLLVLAVTVATMPAEVRVTPFIPFWIERLLLILAGVWFVNLVNFMDGIDWLTVVEVAAIAVGITLIALTRTLPPICLLLALSLLGATIGFAPFNRPTARLFLGDVGSLPVGLLLFWLLVQLAASGYVVAALLLPLYYLADATVTLLRRALNGERITQAHRSHFYQRAIANGMSVPGVLVRVTITNAVLVGLALLSAAMHSRAVDLGALVMGCVAVTALLMNLSRSNR